MVQAADLVGEPGLRTAEQFGDPAHPQRLIRLVGQQAQHQELVVRDAEGLLDLLGDQLLDGAGGGQYAHPHAQILGQQPRRSLGGLGAFSHESRIPVVQI